MSGHINLIKKYFHNLSDQQLDRFIALQYLYETWNSKINVISRKDINQLYERHVLHSLAIAKIVRFRPGSTILDIGTGGGFPGIPLAIIFPQAKFTLVDSVRKKILVVESIAEALELKNVRPLAIRAENVPGYYDFITCRAVTRLIQMHGWVNGKIKKSSTHPIANGMLCLKGGDIRKETSELKAKSKVYLLKDFYKEPFFEAKKLLHVKI
jgi:16S rRNA (guanine527-N7)-methyltransferase